MDKKSLQKQIIAFSIIFVLGFGGLIGYYFYYSAQTNNRKSNKIENILQNKEKTLEDLVKEQESNLKPTKQNDTKIKDAEEIQTIEDYQEYVNEQLNVSSSESEQQMNEIYNKIIQQIRIAAISLNFNQAADIANKALSEHVFEDGQQYGTLNSISFTYGLLDMEGEERFTTVSQISDPVVYLSAFYSMKPEYQIEILKNEQHIYIPVNESNQISLISVEKGGGAESRASEFFSDLTQVEISKVKIEVAGTPYYVYVTGKNGYSYRITNIEIGDKSINTRTTYSDYFRMWGKEDIKIKPF